MKKLTIKSLLTSAAFLLIILIFVYFLIYNPLYNTLEETLLENFSYLGQTNKVSFDHIVERGLENAKSISSRTMIKNKILEYRNGKVNLEELKTYTQPKYEDGITALENVIYSARVVDKEIIGTSGQTTINITSIDYVDELSYEILFENQQTYLLVHSPIEEDTTIGMDIIVFDLTNILENMELGDLLVDIIKEDDIIKYQDKFTVNPLISEHKSSDDIIYLNLFYEINDDVFLHISTPKDTFYYKFNCITNLSAFSLILVFIISFVFINFIIISFTKDRITFLDESNEKHKRHSYYDTLTGAYTRLYLDEWLKNTNKLNYSLVFIDIDDFKDINDEYGHQKGDEVLIEIVSIINNEIRDNDFIVRYGGDEFIVLLDCACKDIAKNIINRIDTTLKTSSLSELKVSFSYGIEELKNTNEFFDVLKKIDLEMYEMKKANK